MPIIPNDTVFSILDLVNRANPVSVVQPPLSRARFALDASGVAGFFGGESAVRAMTTVYFISQRRWLGWYNAPGAYEVAKQYSGLAGSKIFDALFPTGVSTPVNIITMADRQVKIDSIPYTSLYSPTPKEPDPLRSVGAHIAMAITKEFTPRTNHSMETHIPITGRSRITFVMVGQSPKRYFFPSQSSIFTITTILISFGGCIACALVSDWFCFSSIAIGVIANGVACSIIGSGNLYVDDDHPPTHSEGDTPGDVLLTTNTDIAVLIGNKGKIHSLTHGRLALSFGETAWSGPKHPQDESNSDVHDLAGDSGNRKCYEHSVWRLPQCLGFLF